MAGFVIAGSLAFDDIETALFFLFCISPNQNETINCWNTILTNWAELQAILLAIGYLDYGVCVEIGWCDSTKIN